MKPTTYEYVDSYVIDGVEIHAKFDVDYGYRETRDCPGDPGGLYITEATIHGMDVLEGLTDTQVEALTRNAENWFWADYMEEESARDEYLRELHDDDFGAPV